MNASACSSSSSNGSGSGSNAFGGEVLNAGEPAPTCLESTILILCTTGIISKKLLTSANIKTG